MTKRLMSWLAAPFALAAGPVQAPVPPCGTAVQRMASRVQRRPA